MNSSVCAPDIEIDRVLDLSDIMIATASEFFEEDVFDQYPIKNVLK